MRKFNWCELGGGGNDDVAATGLTLTIRNAHNALFQSFDPIVRFLFSVCINSVAFVLASLAIPSVFTVN